MSEIASGKERDSASAHTGTIAPVGPVRLVVCKGCKKAPRNDSDPVLRYCSFNACTNQIHHADATTMMASFGAGAEAAEIVCGKRCDNKMMKQTREAAALRTQTTKKRVRWDNDGPTPDVSSLSCLLDWMTTGDNYSRCRDGDDQQGATKTSIAGEIVRLIAQKGIKTPRLVKDVTPKITAIEASYKTAVNWLMCTGQGVEDESSLKAAILDRCPYYYDIQAVMDDRHSTRPLLLSSDPSFDVSDSDYESISDGDGSDADAPAPTSSTPPPTTLALRPASAPLTVTGTSSRRKKPDATAPHPAYIQLKEAQITDERDFKRMKLEFHHDQVALQREEVKLKKRRAEADELESRVRVQESQARTEKLKQEAEHWRVQAVVSLLRERAKLSSEGVPQRDIDLLLPLTPQL